MLSKGDDYPLHQTAEPVAYAGTDRNFYDRYFFNGYAPDGSGFFAVAFGVYPHLDVCDAHFCAIRDGKQYCLHASRKLGMERLDLACGPLRIEIVEPLHKLRVIVEGEGIAAELTFTGRAFPIEEPRFTWRVGPRTVMDYTRLTQNGHYEGWIEIDGKRQVLAQGTAGTRDRSWGVRPVGAGDPQGGGLKQFFWQWTPVNLPNRSLFWHLNAHQDGQAWNSHGVIASDGNGPDAFAEHGHGMMEADPTAGTRWPSSGKLIIGEETFAFEPIGRFQMRGLGYTSPKWSHGLDHGTLEVEREDIDLESVDPERIDNLHVQMICRVTGPNGEQGIGAFEQLAIGPYDPLGLQGTTDPA